MASARIARFATEVAPPQFVTVMRQRASKMLDTIHEEDPRDVFSDSYSSAAPKSVTFTPSSVDAMPSRYIFKGLKARIPTFSR